MGNDYNNRFFENPIAKAVVIGLLTTAMGGVISSLGAWNSDTDKYFLGKIIALIVLILLWIIATFVFGAFEYNQKKMLKEYQTQNEAFSELLTGIMASCISSAKGANEVAKGIINDGQADFTIWSFDVACKMVCKHVYDLLCKLGDGRNYEVLYDKIVERDGKRYIVTNSYANRDNLPPTIYQKERDISLDNYHDSELFKEGKREVEVVIGNEEINDLFDHQNRESRNKNKKKYSQYIAIPVWCDDNKMIGLFEVVCLKKTCLAIDKERVEELVSRYFMSYTFLLLVFNKLEKALRATPQK